MQFSVSQYTVFTRQYQESELEQYFHSFDLGLALTIFGCQLKISRETDERISDDSVTIHVELCSQ